MTQRLFLLISLIFFGLLNALSLIASPPNDCSENLILTELILVCDGFHAEAIPPPTPNSCDESAVIINNGAGCNSRMHMKVFVANLTGFNSVPPPLNSSHLLPYPMKAMYIEYDSDQDGVYDKKTRPFRDFIFRGAFTPSLQGNHYIFEHELTLSHNFDDLCALSSNQYISGNIMVRLVQKNGGQFELYDLEPFSGMEDYFSCQVFHETNSCCPLTQPFFCDPLPTEYLPASCVDCDTPCEEAPPLNRLSNATTEEQTILQKISPNPFEDQVTVLYNTEEELSISIEVIDTRGNQLQSHLLNTSIGEQSLNLDLSDLSLGVYYCKLRIGSKVETMKLLKLKD